MPDTAFGSHHEHDCGTSFLSTETSAEIEMLEPTFVRALRPVGLIASHVVDPAFDRHVSRLAGVQTWSRQGQLLAFHDQNIICMHVAVPREQ